MGANDALLRELGKLRRRANIALDALGDREFEEIAQGDVRRLRESLDQTLHDLGKVCSHLRGER